MLEDLKLLLGFDPDEEDEKLDKKLELILELVRKRLSSLIGQDVPETMNYIVTEVAVIRFNKIGSEGYASHSVEGESISFDGNEFGPYMDDINAYLDSRNSNERRGGFKFV